MSRMAVLLAGLSGAIAGGAAADVEYGAYLSTQCVTCHRVNVTVGAIPSINGLPTQYFVHALKEYRRGERRNPVMMSVAQALSDEDIEALAAYFEQAR